MKKAQEHYGVVAVAAGGGEAQVLRGCPQEKPDFVVVVVVMPNWEGAPGQLRGGPAKYFGGGGEDSCCCCSHSLPYSQRR